MRDKLSDKIAYTVAAQDIVDNLVGGLRALILEHCRNEAYKDNNPRIETATVINVLRDLKLYKFTEPPGDID